MDKNTPVSLAKERERIRNRIRFSSSAANLQFIREYGQCTVPGCELSSTREHEACLDHAFLDSHEFISAIYLWDIKCIWCSWSAWARGTRGQYRITMLFGTMRCPNCDNPLEVTQEQYIVGRLYTNE